MTDETKPLQFKQTTEADLREITIGELEPLCGQIQLAEYDPVWPELYAREEARVRRALGDRVVQIEHVGSTSVPGLAAKPIIDIMLAVPDSSAEPDYAPDLESAGYLLRIREPKWYQHRLMRGPDTAINLHIFSRDCEEIERMVRFRDRLRSNDAERELYERTKRELAANSWAFVQNYADAKSVVVEGILKRIE